MKIVTTYVAYDDTEFDTEEECRKYEVERMKLFSEFNDVYALYDEKMQRIWCPLNYEIENWYDWIDNALNDCEYVEVRAIPSEALIHIMTHEFGYEWPEDKLGWYKYDYIDDKWVSAN